MKIHEKKYDKVISSNALDHHDTYNIPERGMSRSGGDDTKTHELQGVSL